jgi:uncharacterized membrane protein YfhO
MKYSVKKLLRTEIKVVPHEYQWAAFFLPLFLLGAAFLSLKIHPIGETSLLTCDLFHQYAPILAEIRSKILSGESLFYTWNMGLGTNFWPIVAYNGASPLNLLLLLFPQQYLSDGITLMILIRTGLSGLFFSLLLYKKDGREGAAALALSTVYALSGYVLAYFWALMWMDAVVLLPLVVLGLWKILTGGRARLYVISLFFVILSNFYFGFFVCLFLIVFAPILYLEAKHSNAYERHSFELRPGKAGLRFAGYSILAAGMTAVFLLPTILALKATSAASESVKMTSDFSYTVFDFFSRFLLHADPVIRSGLPNVYVSIAVILLVALYAFCRTIPFSLRMASLGLTVFLYVSMSSPVLNFFWHGMHYTNQLPYRQAFLLCFLLLYMAGQVLWHMDGLSPKWVFCAGGAILFYLILLNQTSETQKNYWLIYGSAAFVLIYTTVFSGFFTAGKAAKWANKIFLYAIILEMFLSAEFALSYINKTEQYTYEPSYGQFADTISKEIAKEDNGQFYRTVLTPALTGNDGALYHVKSISVFASTTPANFVQFMGELGFANNGEYEVSAEGMTEVTARLLGVRHTVTLTGAEPIQDSSNTNTTLSHASVLGAASTGSQSTSDVMYSGYSDTIDEDALPVGFFVPSEGILTGLDTKYSPFAQTNELLTRMGAQDVYDVGSIALVSSSNISQIKKTDTYSIGKDGQTSTITLSPNVSSSSRDVLIYVSSAQAPVVRVSITDADGGTAKTTEIHASTGQIINCGRMPVSGAGTMTVQLLFPSASPEIFSVYCYSINKASLDEATKTLASQPLTVTSYDSSHIYGSVNFDRDGSLFTTIPYDSGWNVKIDGSAVPTQAAYGALLSVPITKGFHEITFSYQPPGFIPGLLISLVLTAGFILLCVWNPIPLLFPPKRKMSKDSQTGNDENSQEENNNIHADE